jgi:tetratricopeptide (TPR) repeat protein
VNHYEEAGAPLKAADALLSVGQKLLKIGNEVPVGHEAARAGDELASLSHSFGFVSIVETFSFEADEDRKVEFKNKALESYKRAFLLYRKAGNVDGMMRAAFRIGNFYLRDELPAWQDTTPTLDVGACSGAQPPSVSNKKKAICYFRELERLAPSGDKKDADIYRLLVWVGGIYHELGESASAEPYFNRAQQTFALASQPDAKMRAESGWDYAAGTAEAAGLYDTALELYRRAGDGFEKAGRFSDQAGVLFKAGNLLRRHGENTSASTNATTAAMDAFKSSIETYKKGLKGGDAPGVVGGRVDFITIGEFAEENYEEELALEAFKLALGVGKGDKLTQARAWSGIASVQAENSPEDARQSYMRSFAFYSELRDGLSAKPIASGTESEEYLKELERISAAVASLDREIKAKAPAAHQTQGADPFCPFPVIAYAQPTATEGDTVTFSAYAVYPGEWQLNYEWTFSSPAAAIVARELKPYPAVRVSTNGVGKGNLTATLVVTGGSGTGVCRQTALATTKVAARPAGL